MLRPFQTATGLVGLLCLCGTGLTGCRALRQDIGEQVREAMAEEPASRNADSQWTTHSTSTRAVPSIGSPHHGDFGRYSQPTTGEQLYHGRQQ